MCGGAPLTPAHQHHPPSHPPTPPPPPQVLLTLLHLNVKNIRVGPKPPAFLTPEALAVLVDKYGLKVTDVKDPRGDVAAMLAGA